MKNERNISLDLLRIVSIFMILTRHFLGWGGAVNILTPRDFNYFWVMPLYFVCGVGNTLFFLLAGFFAGEPKIEKILLIERKTWVYSVIITMLVFLTGINMEIGIKDIITSFFPIVFNKYWFVSVYLILYVMSYVFVPGLEKLKKTTFIIVILCVFLNNTCLVDPEYTLMEGILAFFIGYYLRRFRPYSSRRRVELLFWYGCSVAFYTVNRFSARHFGYEHSQLDVAIRYIFILLAAIMLFAFFDTLNIKMKWISNISENILAVYLVSCNPAIVSYLYDEILDVNEFAKHKVFFVYYLATNVMIFLICILIDKCVIRFTKKEVFFLSQLIKKCPRKKEEEIKKY